MFLGVTEVGVRTAASAYIIGSLLLSTGLSGQALGEEEKAAGPEVKVTTSAESMHVGGELRSEFDMDDHGLNKTAGYPDDKTTTLGVQWAALKLDGNLNKNTEYHFRFNLLNPSPTNVLLGPLNYGYGEHWFNGTVGFSIGKERVVQGGWDNMESSPLDRWTGAYRGALAYYEFDYAVALHVKLAGELTLQILNDKTKGNSDPMLAGNVNQSEHPTFAVAWLGSQGPVAPMIDFGSYDNNKSMWYDAGVKVLLADIMARVDYHGAQIANWVEGPGDTKPKSHPNTNMAVTGMLSYEMKNVVKPWLYGSTFSVKEYPTDIKANLPLASADASPVFNDNKQTVALGVDLQMLGHGWTPYLAYVNTQGEFFKDATLTGDASGTENQLLLGVLGQF